MKPQSSPEPPASRLIPRQVLPSLSQGAWVAVVRPRSLGDIVLTTPALAALKRWRADLRIAFLAEERWAAALEGNPDLDAVIAVGHGPGGRLRAARQARRLRPELAVNFHGGGTAAWLTWLSGAKWRAGHQGRGSGWAVNLAAPPVAPPLGRRRWHTVEHAAGLLHFLGLPPGDLGPARIFAADGPAAAVRQRLQAMGCRGQYAFLNVFPREPEMRWGLVGYRQLVPWLRERYGLAAVIAHPMQRPEPPERAIGDGVCGAGAVMLAPASLAELIALVAGAEIVIGSDGGPLHIAAALAKPVVALFGPTDSDIWPPWRTPLRLLVAPGTAVAWEQVRAAVAQLLGDCAC